MYSLNENNKMQILDLCNRGIITTCEANIQFVECMGIKFVTSPIPKDVRKSLNDAVKIGRLMHKKKDGLKPEVYYAPKLDYIINGELNEYVRKTMEAVAKVCG